MTEVRTFTIPKAARAPLEKFAEVVCPPGLHEMNLMPTLMDELELYLGAMPTHARYGIIAGVMAFNQGARLYPRARGRSLVALDHDTADAYFRAVAHGPTGVQRALMRLMKGLVTFNYYELAPVKAQLEFHPDAYIAEVARRRLDKYSEAIRKGDEAVFAPDPPAQPANVVQLGKGGAR